ncbi:MAG: phytanoyl-CoA dioxygenase family protein [Pseudomonadota bacterium]
MKFTLPQLNQCKKHGWLKCEHLLSELTQARLPLWVDAIASDPSADRGSRLHYYENNGGEIVHCRTERFLDDVEGLKRLLTSGEIIQAVDELFDEPAVLFKEKINYKHPGGAGYAAHQDAAAYPYGGKHITCLVAIDPMMIENGCLEVANGEFTELLPRNSKGCIDASLVNNMYWTPIELQRGSVVFFNSLLPHRSQPNRSAKPRRALYLTYNPHAEGDHRDAYYREREDLIKEAQGADANSNVISAIQHFQGVPVERAS